MIDRILKTPLELWLGLIAFAGGVIMKDNTLLVMSVVFFGTSKILLELKK